MRVLAPQDGVDLDDILLPLQRLQVVGGGHQVRLRWQFHGNMTPVAVGKRAETPLGDKGLQLVLHPLEIGGGVQRPFGDRGCQGSGFCRVGLEGGGDVHPVEGVQVVEVDHMILHILDSNDDISDMFGIGRDLDIERILHGPDRGDGVHRCADTTEALGEVPGITGVAPLQYFLDAAEHGAAAPGVDNFAVAHFGLDAQMPFNAGYGVNDDLCHGAHPPVFCLPSSLHP